MSKRQICLVTSGHVTYCPRLVKEADALQAAGYEVRVVALNHEATKAELDDRLMSKRSWRLVRIEVQRGGRGHGKWMRGALRQKIYRTVGWLRTDDEGMARAFSRFHPELLQTVAAEQADLFVAHTLEALPAVVLAARCWNAKAGLDYEDLFFAMTSNPGRRTWEQQLAELVERKFSTQCAYRTAASPGVAEAVARRHGGAPPAVVMNMFSLAERPAARPKPRGDGPLRLYWFSQRIGPDRGLADAIHAAGLLPRGSAVLHLRGQCDDAGKNYLRVLGEKHGVPTEAVVFHPSVPSDQLITLAAEYDVGLALEEPVSENRIICMRDLCTNKVFTYLLAGLAVAATSEADTREVFEGAGFVYPHGQPEILAAKLRHWLDHPSALEAAKEKSWQLGGTRYNWEREQKHLLRAVAAALSDEARIQLL